ncbi:MAG: hypothetical protein ACD_61C00282G0004 [uncultured bacterium]|nr:MAG: hypothetical protein ACD_61C00282G0004 [uncultured bacterium]
MKKYTLVPVMVLIVLASVSSVYAQRGAGQQSLNGNENQIQVQNRGEDNQIETSNNEQEDGNELEDGSEKVATKEASPRSERALEHMSEVAKQVEILLMARTTKGGIGEEVRQVARDQKQAQSRIETELRKIIGRGSILKALLGPDYKALKNMQEQIVQNELRIQQLEEMKATLTLKTDIAMVDEAIDLMTEQNVLLQEKVASEEKTASMFGWLFRYFLK